MEARDLVVLRGQVADRVEDEVDERELPVDAHGGEVADRRHDLLRARFLAELGDHRFREVDAVHANASLRERERHPTGTDAELERRAIARERREEVDRRPEHLRGEHRAVIVIALRYLRTEVVRVHRGSVCDGRSCRYARVPIARRLIIQVTYARC